MFGFAPFYRKNTINFADRPRLALGDIFQNAMSYFLEPKKSLDIERPARTYVLQFTATTATNKLVIPMYSSFSAVANTDNDTFKTDKSYVSEIISVYDLTADPTKTTNLYSALNIQKKEITLTTVSDGTEKTWEVVCIGVPYQGLMEQLCAFTPSNSLVKIVYDPGKVMVLADSYLNSVNGDMGLPITAKLPLDHTADCDTSFAGSITVATGGQVGRFPWVPWVNTFDYANPSSQVVYFNTTPASLRGSKLVNNTLRLNANPLAVNPATYLSAYFAIAKVIRKKDNANHDALFMPNELVLFIATTVCTTAMPQILSGTAAGNACDLFRLPSRPIFDGEVIIA